MTRLNRLPAVLLLRGAVMQKMNAGKMALTDVRAQAETVLLLDEIIQEIKSDKPEDWLPIFYKRVRKI